MMGVRDLKEVFPGTRNNNATTSAMRYGTCWNRICQDNEGSRVESHRIIVAFSMAWILRTGAPWRDLLPFCGKWGTVYQRIFDLCIAGKGPMQIAKLLTAQHVLTVNAHYAQQDGTPLPEKPYQWSPKSVAGILERPEYAGCTVNFKTYTKSHKLKKRLHNAPENQRIFPNPQPAIIDEQVFARVQELWENKRLPSKMGKQGLFSGLLYCAEVCGYPGTDAHHRQ